MTIEEVIRGFTAHAAYASFREDVLGTIEEGKLADITIVDRDLFECTPQELLQYSVLYTIVHGQVVFQHEE